MKKYKLALCDYDCLSNYSFEDDIITLGSWVSIFPPDHDDVEILGGLSSKMFDRDEYIKNYEFANEIYAILLKRIFIATTLQSNPPLNISQLEIIIGPWLRCYVEFLYIRWKYVDTLKESISLIYIDSRISIDDLRPPVNRNDFAYTSQKNKKWNQSILSEIAKIQAPEKIRIIEQEVNRFNSSNFNHRNLNSRNKFKQVLVNLIQLISRNLSGKRCIIINSAYIPIWTALNICMRLRLWPIFYFTRNYILPVNSLKNREWLNLTEDRDDAFLKFASSNLVTQMPVAYAEGLKAILDESKKLNLPKKPLLIYSGSGAETDDVFRAYVAFAKEEGSKYIISQHGGVFGVGGIPNRGEFIEHRVADFWISWGWTKIGFPNVISGIKMKYPTMKIKSWNPKNRVILFALQNYDPAPMKLMLGEDIDFQKTCKNFLESIDQNYINQLLLRPHPNHHNFEYVRVISEGYSLSKIKSFYRDIERARIFVCASNETMVLEALYFNIPTILILADGINYVREEALHYYKILESHGILHFSPESAADKINTIYDSVEKWWYSEKLQSDVSDFLRCYANKNNKPVVFISKLLESFIQSK